MKKLSRIMALLLLVCSIAALFSSCNNSKYKLTIDDPYGFITEKLNKRYTAGENVTVKTGVVFDADMIAYLDGISLGKQTIIWENDNYHWEFYFVMPSHEATLTFSLDSGM